MTKQNQHPSVTASEDLGIEGIEAKIKSIIDQTDRYLVLLDKEASRLRDMRKTINASRRRVTDQYKVYLSARSSGNTNLAAVQASITQLIAVLADESFSDEDRALLSQVSEEDVTRVRQQRTQRRATVSRVPVRTPFFRLMSPASTVLRHVLSQHPMPSTLEEGIKSLASRPLNYVAKPNAPVVHTTYGEDIARGADSRIRKSLIQADGLIAHVAAGTTPRANTKPSSAIVEIQREIAQRSAEYSVLMEDVRSGGKVAVSA